MPTAIILHTVPLKLQRVMLEPMDSVVMVYPLSGLLKTKATLDQISFGGGRSELIVGLSSSRHL